MITPLPTSGIASDRQLPSAGIHKTRSDPGASYISKSVCIFTAKTAGRPKVFALRKKDYYKSGT